MPEDYQAVLADLGVDTSQDNSQQEATTTDTQEQNQSVDIDTEATQATTEPEELGDDEVSEPEVDDKQRKQNEAFASMRSENSNYKKFMQHLMKGAGFNGSEEEFMSYMSNAAYEQQAKRQGNQVSPEILKRMDEIENQNRTLLDERNRVTFAQNIKVLQDSFNLTDKDIKEFIELAAQEQIDLTVPGTNFKTLYQGLFFDKLNTRMLESERQKWIAQNSKANSAANPDGKSGKKDPTPTDVSTMAEFESLLQSVPNKK